MTNQTETLEELIARRHAELRKYAPPVRRTWRDVLDDARDWMDVNGWLLAGFFGVLAVLFYTFAQIAK